MDPKVFGRDYEQAFPCPERVSDGWRGMSLRDYFAAQALAGLLARSDLSVPHCDGCLPVGEDAGVHYSDIAYRYADAMLKERAK